MIKQPREVSQRVDNSIRECWARLAKLQFVEASKAVATTGHSYNLQRGEAMPDNVRLGDMVEQRMAKVETYLKTAGAQATKDYFSARID